MEILYSILAILFLVLAVVTAVLSVTGKVRFYAGLTATTLMGIMSNVWLILRANLILGKDSVNYVMDLTFDALQKVATELLAFSEMGGRLADTPEEAGRILELFLQELKTAYLALFPFMLILMALVFSYLLCMLIKLVGYSWRKKECPMPAFSEMRVKRTAVLVLLLSFILAQVLPLRAGVIALNIFGVLFFIMMFAGFSMIDFWLKRQIRNGILRFLLYAAVFCFTYFFSGFFTLILAGIGVLDAFCNYRARVVS